MLNRVARRRPLPRPFGRFHLASTRQTVNASALLIGSALFLSLSMDGTAMPQAGYPARAHLQSHRLILDGSPDSTLAAHAARALSGLGACTSYLVFKEPTSPDARSAHPAAPVRWPLDHL
jgi:hypothetical protein